MWHIYCGSVTQNWGDPLSLIENIQGVVDHFDETEVTLHFYSEAGINIIGDQWLINSECFMVIDFAIIRRVYELIFPIVLVYAGSHSIHITLVGLHWSSCVMLTIYVWCLPNIVYYTTIIFISIEFLKYELHKNIIFDFVL